MVKPARTVPICSNRKLESGSDYFLTMLLKFGPRYLINSLFKTLFSFLIALRMPVLRHHKHIYVYHGNNRLTDNTVTLLTNVYNAANRLLFKISR